MSCIYNPETDKYEASEPAPISYPCSSNGTPITQPAVYSGEVAAEATADLISRITGTLPTSPNGSSCSSYRNLSPDESSYSVRRYRYRLAHQPTGTCYLKVWLRRTFTPESGGTPTTEDLPPYTWTGTGNPCIPDPRKSVNAPENTLTSDWTDEDEPAADGTSAISILRWSCLPGYEPGPGDPNGFPPAP